MKHKQHLVGMDHWLLQEDIHHFLRICKQKDWIVYEIAIKKGQISFYTSLFHRQELLRTFPDANHLRTTGMLGFSLRMMKRPSRVLCVLVTAILWFALSHTIFAVEIRGDKQETETLIRQTLSDMKYTVPFYEDDMEMMKAELKKTLENQIAWLEVSKQGSRYHIQYTTKEFATIEQLARDELIAQKDGVIARFDVQHGSKMVGINDLVHKGDVLVSNILTDSKGAPQEVFVKGKVYAYTWKEVRVEMDENDLPEPFQYYQLLFEARRVASASLRQGERIYKENILHFTHNAGTISMDIHYTLWEDITTPNP